MTIFVSIRWAVCLLAILFTANRAFADLKAGAARVDITPQPGVSLDGPISKNGPVTRVHDRLHARALVLDDGSTRLAIVICDACMIGRDVFDAAKKTVHESTGLPTSNILIAATHTHAAPRLAHIGREPMDDEYHKLVAKRVAEAILQAEKNLRPARIGYASFDRPDLIACRRFLCKAGSVGPNPFGEAGERIKSVAGKSSAVIEPAGPVDPQFSILSVQHDDGQPLCVLGNFSVHYCGGYQRGVVSADYFGYFSQAMESALGGSGDHPPVVGIMSNGTSGNTGSFQRAGKKFAPFEGLQFYGRLLAEETAKAMKDIPYRSDVTLKMVETELELDVRRPDDQRLAWARRVLENPTEKQPHRWAKIYAQEARHLESYPATRKIKLQAIRIGDVAIAGCPCEVFAETGLAVKRDSTAKKTFTIELANGYAGYLPPRKQHELGGYETWPARSSFLEVGAEEKIRTTLLGLIERVTR